MSNVVYVQADEVAATKLTVDGQVEHCEIADGVRVREVNSDRPDVFRFEGLLLANEFPLVSGFAFVDGFHFRLLGC